MSTHRIRWTKDEQRAVAVAYAEQRADGKDKGAALRRAQQVLPEGRRRSLNLSGNVTNALHSLEESGFLFDDKPMAERPAAPAPSAVAIAEPTNGIAASIRAVANEVAEQVAAAVFEEIKARLRTLSAEFVKQEARHRPRVLVVGPLPAQQNRLRSEVGELLDLRFVASDEPPRRVKEIAPTCVRTYLWTNYINHAHQEIAKNTVPDRVTLISGGVETLRNALTEFAVQS
jgi:hypothetical protein